jgi:hypothetical protein
MPALAIPTEVKMVLPLAFQHQTHQPHTVILGSVPMLTLLLNVREIRIRRDQEATQAS